MQSGTSPTALVALAALTVAAPAQAADFSIDDDTDLSVYGSIEPKIINETDEDGDDSLRFDDEDSTLGFRAEHGVQGDLVAFGQIELEFSSDDPGNGFDGEDSAFVGLEGGFGKVRAGNFDSVYEDLIIDATEVAEDAEISDEAFASEDNQIAYYSPSFGGFSFRSQVRIQGEDELNGTDVTDNGVGAISNADNEVGISVAGGFTGDNYGVYAGFDDRNAEAVKEFDNAGNVVGTQVADGETYGVAGIVDLAPIELAGKLAVQDNPDNDPAGDHTTFSALRATYDYGRGEIYPAIQQVSPDDGDDRTEFTIGADYRVFSHLTLWSELGRFDKADDEGDNAMVGVILSF